MRSQGIGIRKTVRVRVPSVPFEKIARAMLGTHYELSLVLCGDTLATRMNRTHRQKTYTPNVLTFPLSKNEGEIFLNIQEASREAKRYHTPLRERLTLLFVHACLHLKGLPHGERMERETAHLVKRFI